MMRKLIKVFLAGTAYFSGLLPLTVFLRELLGSGRCTILMYHRVMPLTHNPDRHKKWEAYRSLPGIIISPEMFERQIAELVDKHRVISLAELIDHLERGSRIPRRSVVITFDDGWRDNYTYAFPILKKYRAPATVFLTAGFIGTNKLFWPEKLIFLLSRKNRVTVDIGDLSDDRISKSVIALVDRIFGGDDQDFNRLVDKLIGILKFSSPEERDVLIESLGGPVGIEIPDDRVMLNWDEVRLMQQSGISFGSHGLSHRILTRIEPAQQDKELRISKNIITEQISSPPLAFAYPNGNHDRDLRELVRAAGYRCALGVRGAAVDNKSDRYALPRINVHEQNSAGLGGGFSKSLFAWHIHRMFR